MLSRLSCIFCSLVIICGCLFFYPKWNAREGEAPIGWDVSGYYWYIPSVFIYKDLKYQQSADSILKKYKPTPDVQQFTRYPDGSCVMTYSSGMAFMYLPLFAVAHLLAPSLGYPADGFSVPYQFAMQVGGMLFALIGLWYFRKLLLLYFEDKVAAVLLLLLVIGTNYLNYASIDGTMTHAWLFTLYIFLLLNTHYFYKAPSFKYALRIGQLIGLMILIRPSEMVAILIPLLWGMESFSFAAVNSKLAFLKLHLRKIAVAAACVICIGSIQLIYWKYASGHWLVYSYGNDKGFSWLPPHTDQYMFSYRTGWLRYTPMMLLAIVGIIPFIKTGKNKVAILTFTLINLYVVSAWDIWWYGGRAMIQSYAVFFFPMGTLVQMMLRHRLWQWVLIPCFIFFSYINLWVIIQEHKGTGLLDMESMSKEYYWRVLGRWHLKNIDQIQKLKDTDELFEGVPKNMKLIYLYNYEQDTGIQNPMPPIEGNVSDYIAPGRDYSKMLQFPFSKNHAKWLRAQGTFRFSTREWTAWKMPQFTVQFRNNGNDVKTRAIRVSRTAKQDETKDLFLDCRIPSDAVDSVKIFCWNPGSDYPVSVDNIKVWLFDE